MPDSPSTLQALAAGRAALERGDAASAREHLRGIDHFEACYLLALACTQLGLADEAIAAFERALALNDGFTQARIAYARLLVDLGQGETAVPHYEQAAAEMPDSLPVRYGLATARLGSGAIEQAEADFDAMLAAGHDRPEIRFMRARARLELGRIEDGLADLEQAWQRQPSDYCLKALAGALWMLGEEARLDRLLEAAAAHPALVPLAADLLRQSGRADRAAAMLRKLRRHSAASLSVLSEACIDLQEAVAAEEAARGALQLEAEHRGAQANLISALLMQSRAAEALAVIEPLRRAEPLGQHWIAYETTAWRQHGDPRYAERADLERFVRSYRLPVPDGYASAEAFNAALLAALEPWHHFARHPLDQSLRHGSQTSRDLTSIDDPVIEAYIAALDAPIRDYMDAVGQSPDHPLTARNTGEYSIAGCWSVRLSGGGRHVNHVHPEGWISSAYYVSVPPSGADRAGWIKFGEPPFACDPPLPPEHWLQPDAGMLVLFPSFLWHGTEAIADGAVRVTAPFDVVPR